MSKNKEKKVDSTISSVTVFTDRAQVTRSAVMNLTAGDHILLFSDLPQEVEQNSIQVNGTGKAVLSDVKFQSEHFTAVPQKDKKKLLEERQTLQDQMQYIKDRIGESEKEKLLVEGIAKKVVRHTGKVHEEEMNIEKWIQLTAFYRNKLEELNEQVRLNKRAQRELEKDLAKIELDIHDLGNEEFKTVNQVLVSVHMKEEGEASLNVSYIVYGPAWYPVYDVRVSAEEKNMNISYNGIIQQATGEDWDDVGIKLSTAQVQVSGQQPELSPWHIHMEQPPVQVSMPSSLGASRSMKAKQMFEAAASIDSLESEIEFDGPPEMESAETVVETGTTAVVFAVGGSNTIKGDNKDHKVTNMIKEFPAQFRYSSVPKLSPYAYLKAKVKNSTDYPFLAGETNVFLDNNFVSTAFMDLVAPTEEFWTFLGVDESIKVDYKLLKKYHKEEGMIGKKTVLIYEYLTKITNNKKTEEEMVLWDQVPISNDEDITVKLMKPNYKEDTEKLKKNESEYLEWFFKLKPGEKVEVPFTFSVEYPRGKYIAGL